ncbi:related to protein histidine kinase [Phialocephala subalpina]|uniref:histidine kinase n=1 Tax=Phialocephala subalpina TaxID=576137 RepID=A0A1L7WK08_9HELO|nr:related to protein histidine kinase [Phialocephala subalpina]
MRVPIRIQLGLVVLLCALVPLAVLAIAVWINNHSFIVDITSKALTLTASLKASQIASDLLLIQSTCSTIVTRILLQQALKKFYAGNTNQSNWDSAVNDVHSALVSGGFSSLLQTVVYPRNATENSTTGLFRITANTTGIQLPAKYPNGTHAVLGDDTDLGYPTALYPNITYVNLGTPDDLDPSVNATEASAFADFPLNDTSFLLLGPLSINTTYALVSLTLPITNISTGIVYGYMTVVAAATSIMDVMQSREGLANTGIVTIIGPSRRENQFKYAQRPANATYSPSPADIGPALVHYVLPPLNVTGNDRHSTYNHNLTQYSSSNFTLSQYPAAVAGFSKINTASPNNASAMLSTTNEQGVSVAVGYARPQSTLVSWLLIVEQSHDEAWAPINHLRNIVLACVFGTLGFIILIVVPMAHLSVRPIRRLRDATKRSIAPPGYTPNGSIRSDRLEENDASDEVGDMENGTSQKSKRGLFVRLRNLAPGSRRKTFTEKQEDERRRVFKIPGKVPTRKHLIHDELTELTGEYSLEQKVAERTAELEVSKRAAEAANESKTLFIANISHELKTPLNGVLGMCAVMMHEDNLEKIQRGLSIVQKSGDLLLNLLNDLLLFSKNQIGQQLSLEEREFRLVDIKTQINTLFRKQVTEGGINFAVRFIGVDAIDSSPEASEKALPALGPSGVRLKDMCLWGDHNRILQVIINLVGNALKFTPVSGKVEVRIKCIGEVETTSDGSRNSMNSKQSSQRSRNRYRNDSESGTSSKKPSSPTQHPIGTALLINPMDPKAIPRVQVRERSRSPPPTNAKTLWFQFEVEDTGPGIPEAMQERVFEPFVQGDLGLSKKYGGTGLGLSICSQLANLMGGTITLVSKEGSGSTFTMRIPLRHTKSRAPSTSSSDIHSSRAPSISDDSAPRFAHKLPSEANSRSAMDNDKQPRLVGLSQPFFAAPPTPPAGKDPQDQLDELDRAAAAKEPGSKLRVLVAEDNLVNQEVVLRMLKLEGKFDVVIAKDGQEAYDKVKETMAKGEFFDVIFMDIQMPNLDGLQSTRLIRQMGYSAPIVALTAFAEESNVKECLASGMDMFLSKPIRRPALKQVLKRFATIPEENETSSVANTNNASSSAPSELDISKVETTAVPDTPIIRTANGSKHR